MQQERKIIISFYKNIQWNQRFVQIWFCLPVFFMALEMLFKMELIFPRSTLARFKGAELIVLVGVVTVDEGAVWAAAGSGSLVGLAKVGDLTAVALVALEIVDTDAFSVLSSTKQKKHVNNINPEKY